MFKNRSIRMLTVIPSKTSLYSPSGKALLRLIPSPKEMMQKRPGHWRARAYPPGIPSTPKL